MPTGKSQFPEILSGIATDAIKLLVAKGMEEKEAMAFAFELTESIRCRWGGDQIYIPRRGAFTLAKRNAEIVRESNGMNTQQLGQKYGLTRRHIQSIIKAAQQQKQKRNSNEEEKN